MRFLPSALLLMLLAACSAPSVSEPQTDPDATIAVENTAEPTATAQPSPVRTPGQVRYDPARLLEGALGLPAEFIPMRSVSDRRERPYPLERLDRSYLQEEPLSTLTVGALVADSEETASVYYDQHQRELAQRYRVRVFQPLYPPAEGAHPQVDPPSPAPSASASPAPSASASPAPADASPAPSPSSIASAFESYAALGARRAVYAVRLENEAKGYLCIWTRGPSVGTVVLVAAQEVPVPDSTALALLERTVQAVDASLRAGLAGPERTPRPMPIRTPGVAPSQTPEPDPTTATEPSASP